PILQADRTPPYFSLAWNNREHISGELGKPLKDAWVSLAVNSKYGRSQNQLHIHVACLRQDVYNALGEQAEQLDQQWRPLAVKLVGHHYL
ncbi:CDP-diacylglycerol diphosphatase, partial [Escherichia coli]|uniref:CDP-diacylglycerol diphosphatase n=2 Tax=Enterobacterales TaxID=91347 RepID=UPI00390CCA3B